MASSAGNVVALGEHMRARASGPRAEFADALSACRRLALERMGQALSGMLDHIEDELFELAEAAGDREQQNTYLDARSQARAKRGAIENAFRAHFVDLFDRKVRGPGASAPAPAAAGELSLVEPEDLEEALALREMSRKLGAACEGELFALSQRLGFMLERPELADEANPLSPDTICRALKDACDQIESGFKVRMALLRQLERHAEAALNGMYHEVNAHLIERRIMPEVRHAVRRTPPGARNAMSAMSAPDAMAGTPAANAAAATPRPGEAAASGASADVFRTIAQWLAQAPSLGTAAAAAAVPGPSTNAAAPSAPAPTDAQFFEHLTRLHREAVAPGEPALVNAVRALKSSPLAASLGSLDAMTIDVVGMLFDYIFEDRHIPASVKAHLGRLQLPTLKVALIDKAFFSSSSHPARRLIDLLAECAIGIDESHAEDSDVLRMVEGVVGTVLAEFESDLGLFATQVARVEAFITERRDAEAALVERSARLLEERERREAAMTESRTEVERRIEGRPWLAAPVRAMLRGAWVAAMADALLEQGVTGAPWQDLASAMDELLWSVEPKSAPEDRRRLVSTLPKMLGRLAAGMERGGMEPGERDAFFGALVDSHAHAVKAGLRGVAALPQPVAPEVPQPGGLARERVPAGELQLEEIRLRPATGVPRNVFTRTGIWVNLQRGTWVEFVRPEGPRMRARLTWISPNKGVYLFTNPLSHGEAISISPEALAEQMRLGEARLLDDGPLVDRAVGSMMASLRPAA
jgi:hypothetical protein